MTVAWMNTNFTWLELHPSWALETTYTIFEHKIRGRLQITRLEGGAVNPKSGKPRALVFVRAPGERLDEPIPRKGHQGMRYYDGRLAQLSAPLDSLAHNSRGCVLCSRVHKRSGS